jgi:PadR family transcriptional regulator PadR
LKKQLHDLGYDINAGSLYPLLHALEKALLLRSRVKIFKGRARKYYDITDQERAVLKETQKELAGIMTKVLSGSLNTLGPTVPKEYAKSDTNNHLS